jgi:hypothetical protein
VTVHLDQKAITGHHVRRVITETRTNQVAVTVHLDQKAITGHHVRRAIIDHRVRMIRTAAMDRRNKL